jgi:hypothetical protein
MYKVLKGMGKTENKINEMILKHKRYYYGIKMGRTPNKNQNIP